MPEDVLSCPLCGAGRSALFDSRSYRGHKVTSRVCLACGLVFQSPRMTEAEAAEFYTADYRMLQENTPSPGARNVAVQKARASLLLDFVRPDLPAVSRHLDIGCSVGILLARFQESYQDEAVGVEPDKTHRAIASKEGLTVYPALGDLEKAGEERFDLVSMSHVLEHFPDPVGTLVSLRERLLTEDGRLLLEVPNLYAHDSFEVAHLFAFSQHTLREVLYKSGFEIEKFKKHGLPNSAILPLFLTLLCRPVRLPEARPVQPEHGVMFKRRFGMFRRRLLARLFPHRAWLVLG